ncbi:alpha/beta fold hydrolase [Shinella granuli]|uniref:Pimeloyl-ACP methyl ester carboxylesterase n=1 Tax=Shinella granuli TaxID=323621 RepID=A0A4R2D1V5_SHIGR|nr:alpha/beta hydrolase [Shinella granuli]TCN47693.1 pimeloyl-ACP methyl ester carboxylesterase [Shinella granuli]
MDGFESRFFSAEDGVLLHARDYAPATAGGRLPLVCLPGLSRNARDFHPLALRLARDPAEPRRVIALDYRGRGLSGREADPASYNVAVECRDALTVLSALGLTRALFAGTSRGGLILHVMAAVEPGCIAGAILNDIGPQIEADGLREINDYLSRTSAPASFEAAAEGLKAIHGATFPALAPADWHDMAEAIYAERDGRIVADFDPRLTDQLKAIDFSKPLPTLWPQFELLAKKPLLVVRGERSRLFSRQTLARMAAHAATVQTLTAPGQGHAPLLHHADVFPSVRAFLSGLG